MPYVWLRVDDSRSGFWAILRHLLYQNTHAKNITGHLRTWWWIAPVVVGSEAAEVAALDDPMIQRVPITHMAQEGSPGIIGPMGKVLRINIDHLPARAWPSAAIRGACAADGRIK